MALNRYAWWKNTLIILTLLVGIIYALPNLYGEDPAIQIIGDRGAVVNPALSDQVKQILDSNQFAYKTVELSSDHILVRLKNADSQLQAKDAVKLALGDNYIVALNLAPATPAWLTALGATPIKLGLDLRGGVHFLMEVDIDSAIKKREESYADEIRGQLRNEKLRYTSVGLLRQGGLTIMSRDAQTRTDILNYLETNFPQLTFSEASNPTADNFVINAQLSTSERALADDYVMDQSLTTLRNRVNELGVAEALVQRQGSNRIIVQLPGVQDTARAKEIIGKIATLEFLMVDNDVNVQSAVNGNLPIGTKIVYDEQNRPYVLDDKVILSGDSIIGASSGTDDYGRPAVFVRVGGNTTTFQQLTQQNIGKQMASVYIETRVDDVMVNGEKRRVKTTKEEAISVATIQSGLGNSFQITGVGSIDEARNLALLLRAGALPATIDFVEERTVGPSLGLENIEMGVRSVIVGLVCVLAFMAVYYHLFGLFANIALVANLILLLALLSLIGATLTLPGIAGIVLTLGMAVDGNVLIDERIREEFRNGTPPQASINAGYEKALVTILDANITTLIAALALFSLGSGPIKGFAVTLSVGLLTSVFTGVMVSRMLVNYWYGGRNVKKLSIGI